MTDREQQLEAALTYTLSVMQTIWMQDGLSVLDDKDKIRAYLTAAEKCRALGITPQPVKIKR